MQQLTENQALWLAALRSGDFKQGRLKLRSHDDEFCCLGVAAEIFKPEGLRVERNQEQRSYFYGPHAEIAPNYVIEALKLYSNVGSPKDRLEKALAELNDDGASFAEIADIIESDPAIYFRESN